MSRTSPVPKIRRILPSGPTRSGNKHEGYQLCPSLAYGEICFCALNYDEGKFEGVGHEHIPAQRIAQERSLEVLRSLVARFSEWPAKYVIHSYLNRRPGVPHCYPGFTTHASYAEPGVIRQYISSPAVTA